MQALVIGLGVSGRSACALLQRKGYEVVGLDQNPCALPFPTRQEMPAGEVESFDVVVVSPGIPRSHPVYQEAKRKGIPLVGEVELACRELVNPMIGITGTNGKTTTTALIAHILNFHHINALAVGNYGKALSEVVLEEIDPKTILVVELSSYQLETLEMNCFDAAAILNITPDHLERYNSLCEYGITKLRIQDCMKKGAPLFLDSRIVRDYAQWISYRHLHSVEVSSLSCDEANERMAILLCRPFLEAHSIEEALQTFAKPSHRMQHVATIRGIDFIDDSKATNVDSVIKGVEMMGSREGKIFLIAGGTDKGFSYQSWAKAFMNKVDHIYVIGEAAENIQRELQHIFPITRCTGLRDAVHLAREHAVSGDVVLLSPGCSSYDMFENYRKRGEAFQSIVMDLQKSP